MTLQLTVDELRKIRIALETETIRREDRNDSKAKEYDELLNKVSDILRAN